MTILSWNVNGIRASYKKGFVDWLGGVQPEVLALQETKARPEQLAENLLSPGGYHSVWSSAERKGYSGVAVYSREEPTSVSHGFGINRFDSEGRTLIVEFDSFILFNIYFPNGKQNKERLQHKINFYRAFFEAVEEYRKTGKTILACGDFNTAHQEIDLARPKENSSVSGFLPDERALLDEFIASGFADSFRLFHPDEPGRYSWWDMKSRARDRNVGWRIDYFFIDTTSKDRLTDAFIMDEVTGSDHCPVGVTLK